MTVAAALDPRQGCVRGVRAAVLTAPAVAAAGLAHSLTDGCGSLLVLLLAAGLLWPAAVAVLGARRRLPVLLCWLLGAQLLTHLLLVSACSDVTSGQEGAWQHLQAGLTPATVAAHLCALAATATLLSRADAGLWTARALIRGASRMWRLAVMLPAPPTLVRLRLLPLLVQVLEDTGKVARPPRRGPPALLLAR